MGMERRQAVASQATRAVANVPRQIRRRNVNRHARLTRSSALVTSAALGGALLLASVLPSSVFAAAPVTHYVIAASPIAPAGTLVAGATRTISVAPESSTNAVVPGAVVYLSFSQTTGGGSASVGTTPLTSTPVAYTASALGHVFVTYKTPSILPKGGKDIVKAANAASLATITASDFYSFSKVAKYTFSPNPIATPGSLTVGGVASVTLTSFSSLNAAVSGAVVYLSFVPAAGGGTASVGTKALTSTPVAFPSSIGGQIVITYHAPAKLPTSGSDTISATDATKNATMTRSDSYSFAAPHSYVFSPNPVAPLGSLGAAKTVTLKLTVLDAGLHPVAGVVVWLYFTPTTNGGAASVGSKVLSATPARFLTSSAGTVTVTYKSSATPPASGADTIHAENLKVAPTIIGSDAYTY